MILDGTWEDLNHNHKFFILLINYASSRLINRVKAHSPALKSSQTCETSQTFFSSTVLPPPQFSATSSPSNDSIIVSWDPVAYAVQYTLSIYKLGSNTTIKHNTTNTNLTITGLDAGSLYNIKSYAWDPEGRQGDRSLCINQTTRKETQRHLPVFLYSLNCCGHYISVISRCAFIIICVNLIHEEIKQNRWLSLNV